jgi:hypothetical protein
VNSSPGPAGSVTARNARRLAPPIAGSGALSPPEAGAGLNARLGRPPVLEPAATRHMGLYVVGHLAQRHGIRVQLRERPYGGIAAHVILPSGLVRTQPEPPGRNGRAHQRRPQPRLKTGDIAVPRPSPAPRGPSVAPAGGAGTAAEPSTGGTEAADGP